MFFMLIKELIAAFKVGAGQRDGSHVGGKESDVNMLQYEAINLIMCVVGEEGCSHRCM